MSETKEDIAAERDALRAENENLRGQLAAAGARQPGRAAPVEHQFMLSEGQRQELELTGVTTVGGRMVDAATVRENLGEDQARVEIEDVDPAVAAQIPTLREPAGIAGVDFVWPSVEPGKIDPEVVGTPGINGPAASSPRLSERVK